MFKLALTVVVACAAASFIAATPVQAEEPRALDQPYDCDEDRRGEYETVIVGGHYWQIVHCQGAGEPLQKVGGETVPADEPAPGVTHQNLGERHAVYEGDRVRTPYCARTDTGQDVATLPHPAGGVSCSGTPTQTGYGWSVVIRWELRTVDGGPDGPATNTDVENDVRYQPNANHRAVQDERHCYREWRDREGNWRRSGSYGTGEESCRRAAWNAFQRSQGLSLYHPNGTFPTADPPGDPPGG